MNDRKRRLEERRQAGDALRAMALFPQENPNPILRFLPDGRILFVNEPGRLMLGELGWRDTLPIPAPLLEAGQEALSGGEVQEREIECASLVYECVFAPIVAEGYVNLYARDSTRRKRAEEEVRQSREWLRVTLSSIGDAVMTTDTGGRITFLNPVAEALTGWTRDEALNQPIATVFNIINEQTGEPAEDIAARVLSEGCAFALANHTALIDRDGRQIPIEDSAAPIRNHTGDVDGVVLVFHDVTEKRRAQDALRASEQRVRLKLESILSPDGDIGNLELADILDVPAVQALMEQFRQLVNIPMAIIDLKGEVLVGVGWQEICTRFHRVHPETCAHCIESDTQLSAGVAPGEFKLYQCKNHMWDVATPIVVGGHHVGNLFTGQFFLEGQPLDRELFRAQARRYGFNEAEYLAALEAVPRLSQETVDTGMAFLMRLAHMLSQLSHGNLKLARSLAERKRQEAELHKLNRTLKALNNSNQALLRATDEATLLRDVCQIVTQDCGYAMVWIGFAEEDGARSVRPAACAGFEEGYLETLKITWADSERGRGPTGTAIRSGQPCFCRDMLNDPRFEPWREQALQRGYASSMVLPLMEEGRAFGAITIYSRNPDPFSEEEVRLMIELAGDLAYGISALRLRAAHAQAEEALRLHNEQLADADRRKDEFLAMLSHELRNPLAPVRNCVQVLRMVGASDPLIARQYDVIERQVGHMARLLDDLLDISRITRGKVQLQKRELPLAETLTHAVEIANPLIESRRHTLTITLPPENIRLEADPDRLAQIVGNLLANAAKYSDEAGQIWLEAERAGSEAVIRVRDTGMGIAPEMLPRVFDLFAQAERSLDRSQGGLGIGLTLVRSLVEMHGGRVQAHSPGIGKGSEFVIHLPALPEAPPAPARTQTLGARADKSCARRVLVVDDVADSAETLAELLGLWGHEARIAQDGPAALETARAYRPEVVLLDIGLPGMNGYEVARRLRQESDGTTMLLVAMSGYAQESDRQMSREAGFDEHLAKPIDLGALRALLARPVA